VLPDIEYLSWFEGRPEAAMYDLGSSDLRGDRGFDPVAVPPRVADLSDPPAGVSVETVLATEYGVHPEQVVVTAGATHANFLAVAAALDLAARADRPERVVVEVPGYEPLVKTPEMLGADVERFERPRPDYPLDPDRMRGAAAEAALVTVTNRHNPSGRLSDRETLDAAAAAARDAGGRLLVDEVYAPYVPEGRGSESAFGGVTAAGLDGAVVTGSLTKFFGLGDVRLGWLIADREFVAAARRAWRHVPAVAGISRAVGTRALYGAEDLTDRSRDLLRENAAALREFVDRRGDVSGTVFEGSTYAFLDVEGFDGDEVVAAAWERGVLAVPGRFFGDPRRVRVSLGRDPESTRAALASFGGVLDDLRARGLPEGSG
jgi:aspartate/methionine/tyrosine aminotransferase